MAHNKVLVIGIDSATIDFIKRWSSEGKLPNFRSLLSQGVHGCLKTVPSMNSAPAWVSIYTGRNPGNHGIFYFYEKKQNSYEIRYLNGSDCDSEPVWSILGKAGKYVGVINVPMTYPAMAVNGFMISGLDAPGLTSKAVFPQSILGEIKKNSDYVIELGLSTYARQGRFDKLIEKALHSIKMRTKAALHFMDNKKWDFFMVVYREIDIIQHAFWKFDEAWYQRLRPDEAEKYKGTILSFYQTIDEEIGKLLKRTDSDTTILIVSDHGGAPFDYGGELLNDFLSETGYLKYHRPGKTGIGRHCVKNTLKNIIYLAEKYVPRKFKELLLRFCPQLRNKTSGLQVFPSIDWRRTKVFGTTRPELWINLKGREPLGTVEPGKPFDDLIRELKDKLMSWIDPQTGEHVLKDVKTKEELYYGKNLYKSPDLILFYNRKINPAGIAFKQDDGSLKTVKKIDINANVDSFISGSHGDNGTIIIKGPQIKSGQEIKDAKLIDVVPTVLYILLTADFKLDGNILKSAFNQDFLQKHPPLKGTVKDSGNVTVEEYTADEAKIIADKLRGLGYL